MRWTGPCRRYLPTREGELGLERIRKAIAITGDTLEDIEKGSE